MMAECADCDKDEVGDLGEADSDQFWIKMEHMPKNELIKHIADTECPNCGSDHWKLTDVSKFSGTYRTPRIRKTEKESGSR